MCHRRDELFVPVDRTVDELDMMDAFPHLVMREPILLTDYLEFYILGRGEIPLIEWRLAAQIFIGVCQHVRC